MSNTPPPPPAPAGTYFKPNRKLSKVGGSLGPVVFYDLFESKTDKYLSMWVAFHTSLGVYTLWGHNMFGAGNCSLGTTDNPDEVPDLFICAEVIKKFERAYGGAHV